MRPGARHAAAPAALAALACLAAAPYPASAARTPGAGSSHTPAASRATRAAARTATAARTGAGARATAATIGGPLMASHGVVVDYPDRKARRVPSVPASSWVIANASTGQVLAARDPHGKFGPASTMKVLTAITLIPLLKPAAMVLASRQAADTEPMDAGLVAGRRYQVASLFTALLTISANDAAVALTQATGSLSKGMALINAEARHLQAYDVVARRPNGLPAAGQVESAYDEALIARQALSNPQFMKYDSTLAARFEVKPRHWETLVNQNWLLTKYKGALGGKIGWTVSSEATYVGLARRNGVTLIVTIMHCTPLQEITSAVKLLNWGFAMNGSARPVGVLVPPLTDAVTTHHASPVRKVSRPAASLARAQPAGSSSLPVHFAVAAGVLVVAGLGLAALARRRRAAVGRHRL